MPAIATLLVFNLVGAPTLSPDPQTLIPSLGTLVAQAEPLELELRQGVEPQHAKTTLPTKTFSTRLEDEPEACRNSIFSTADCTPTRIESATAG